MGWKKKDCQLLRPRRKQVKRKEEKQFLESTRAQEGKDHEHPASDPGDLAGGGGENRTLRGLDEVGISHIGSWFCGG